MQTSEETEGMDLSRAMPLGDPTAPNQQSQTTGLGRLPNFLIIGAARSGTTTLHYVLGQHPQIYMSPAKETNFFSYYCSSGQTPLCTRLEDVRGIDNRSVTGLDEYRRLFRAVTRETAVGEASPSYLLTPGVPEAIRRFVPEAKIIAVLRQPIDKAYSHFVRKCQAQIYSLTDDFAKVLEEDEARIKREGRGTSFLGHARYADYLKPYFDVFEPGRLKICLFEEMQGRPQAFYADLFRFLGVDASFQPDVSTKFNQSGRPSNSALMHATQLSQPLKSQLRRQLPPTMVTRLSRWRHKLQSANVERAPELPPALRRRLTERYFGEDIARLEKLIGRDLSHWLA